MDLERILMLAGLRRLPSQPNDLDEKFIDLKLLQQWDHPHEMIDIPPADRIDETDLEALRHRFLNIGGTDPIHTLAPDRIVYRRIRAVETETEIIELGWRHFFEKVVKEKPVGVYRYEKPLALGVSDCFGEIFVQRRLSAQENNVGSLLGVDKEIKPRTNRLNGQGLRTVLLWVDITMTAGKVAGSQDVEKDISFSPLEADSTWSCHDKSLFLTIEFFWLRVYCAR